MKSKFAQLYDGDQIRLNARTTDLVVSCCCCGAAHRIDITARNQKTITIRYMDDREATKEARAERRISLAEIRKFRLKHPI